MNRKSERLNNACSSFFLFLGTFRRNAKSSNLDIDGLRAALNRELEKVQEICLADQELAPIFEKVRYTLVTTADQVILTSPWPHRAGWSMQLLEAQIYGTREGGRRVFQLIEGVIDDPSDDAVALARVLFHCLGLGFQGELRKDPDRLQKTRLRLLEKARLPSEFGDSITPEAYGRNSARSMLRLPTLGILRFVLVTIAAVVFTLLAGNAVTAWKNRQVESDAQDLIEDLRADAEPR